MHYQQFTLPALATVLVVSCFVAQSAQGQFVTDPSLWENQFNQASAQISSARNYDLLRPIASRPKPSTGMLQPQAPSQQPLQPVTTTTTSKPTTTTTTITRTKAAPPSPVVRTQVVAETPPAPKGLLVPMVKASSTPIIATLPVTLAKTTPAPPTRTQAPQRIAQSQVIAAATSAEVYSIEVSPHSFRSGALDEYEFKIYNPAPHPLRSASVKLIAPAGSRVAQVIPKPKSVAGEEIVFEIGELAPGGQQIVEVLIENPRDELVQFESSIVSQTWNGTQVAVSQVSTGKITNRETNREMGTDDQIINRELRLEPLAGVQLLEPLQFASQESVDTARRDLEQTETPMDAVLQSEYDKAFAENVKRESLESFPLTPETASETKQFGRVASLLSGPHEVIVGEEVEFAVSLKNETTQTADSLIVQLSVPEDFKVTVLDRAAWYDAEGGKISWKVPAIQGQGVETIRYRAVARSAGLVKQGVVVGMDNKLQGFCTFKTQVR